MHDAICVAIEFLLIFSETNFVEVLKIRKIRKIYSPRNKYVVKDKLFLLLDIGKLYRMDKDFQEKTVFNTYSEP